MPKDIKFKVTEKGTDQVKGKFAGVDGSLKKVKITITSLKTTIAKYKKEMEGAVIGSEKFRIAQEKLKTTEDRLRQALGKTKEKVDKTDKSLGRMRLATSGLQRQVGILRNKLLLVTFALGGFVLFIKKNTDAYRVQLEAQTKLISGLANVEGATAGAAQKLFIYASALQKATTFGDEHIISAMAQLATFQMNETQIAAITPRILDMAAAIGTKGDGLTNLAVLAGKAFTGQTGALSRYGVMLDKSALKTRRMAGEISEFNFLLEQMDANYRGMAAALRNTLLGELDAMELEIGDINEIIGRQSIPILSAWTKAKLSVSRATATLILYTKEENRMREKGMSFQEAWNQVLNDEIEIDKALFDLRIKMATTRDLGQEQRLDFLRKEHEFLVDDNVIDTQEKIALLELQKIQLSQQFNEGLITRTQLSIKSLEIDNQILTAQGRLAEAWLEQQSVYVAALAGYDVFINSLTDMEMSGKARREKIWEATKAGFTKFLGEMIKEKAKQLIIDQVMSKTAEASAIASAVVTGTAIASAYATPAALASAATFGAAAVAGSVALAGSVASAHALAMFAEGGSFMVGGAGGTDSQLVAFKASPNERVTIETPGQVNNRGGDTIINIMGGIVQPDYIDNVLIPALNESSLNVA